MKKLKQLTKYLLILTVISGLIYTAFGAYQNLASFTSFPWWSALAFSAMYFGPLLVLEVGILVLIRVVEKGKS